MRTQNRPSSPSSGRTSSAIYCPERNNRARIIHNRGPLFRLALLGFILCGSVLTHAAQAPVILPISDQFTLEDRPILEVPFTVGDPDTPANQLRFSTSLIFTNGVGARDSTLIVIGGTGTNRWFSIYPPPDASGLAQATITVLDNSNLSATARFQVQVNPMNDSPRLSRIPDQTVLKGQVLLSVPFWVNDPETSASQLRLKAWSSRQSVVNNAGLRFTQGTPLTNRNLLISLPAGGSAGSTAITIQADDSQSSNTVSFIFNVSPPDFDRSSNVVAGAVDGFQPIWGDFNGDGLLDLLSSPSQIHTNRGNGLFTPGIPLPGGIAGSSATTADFDGDGNLDLLVYGIGNPRLLRNSGGSVPTFSEVPLNLGAQTIYRGRALWADMDGDGDLDIVGGTRTKSIGSRTTAGEGSPISARGFPVRSISAFWPSGTSTTTATPTSSRTVAHRSPLSCAFT